MRHLSCFLRRFFFGWLKTEVYRLPCGKARMRPLPPSWTALVWANLLTETERSNTLLPALIERKWGKGATIRIPYMEDEA